MMIIIMNLQMFYYIGILFLIALFVNYFLFLLQNRAKVVKIIDGDTIAVKLLKNQKQIKIRLILINAPESRDSLYMKKQFYGDMAKIRLQKFLPLGSIVTLEYDKRKFDNFERTLAYVYYKGILINEYLVKEGCAEYAEFPPNLKYSKRILKAEIQAKRNKVGMWQKK